MHDEYCEAIRFKSGLCNCKERSLSDGLNELVGVRFDDERPKVWCSRCEGTGLVLGYTLAEEERPFICEPDLNYGCPLCSGEGYVLDTNIGNSGTPHRSADRDSREMH